MNSEREYSVDERVCIRNTSHRGTVARVIYASGGRRYTINLDDGTTLHFVSGRDLESAWPYKDADPNHPLTARRVPVIDEIHPEHMYEVALCIGGFWEGQEPTPDEVELLVSYINYRQGYYTPHWQARHRKSPLDTDSSTNTVILMKYPHGGWGFRRASYTQGPPLIPALREEPRTLASVLDRINSIGDVPYGGWTQWKVAHPDVFGHNKEG